MASSEESSNKWTYRFGAILSLAAIAGLATTYSETTTVDTTRRLKSNSHEFIMKTISSNEYGETVHPTEYPWLSGKLVVEPHRVTTLKVVPAKVTSASMKYQWDITDPEGNTFSTLMGASVTTTFTLIGKHEITVSVLSKTGSVLDTYDITAHSLYVKRELRKLTEEDRENFLDAMHMMWTYGSNKGREIYGEDFTGMDRYVYIHAREASGALACDKWHEGSGFLTHHLALATSFDLSLQAIDKRVTTPYWDFTIEGEKLYKAKLGPKSMTSYSPLLSDNWFGVTDELDHVVSGRWAHTASVVALKGTVMKNSYGILRAPWNNANDRELLRHNFDVCGLEPVNKPIPACMSHYKVLNTSDLGNLLLAIAGYGHGPMHVNTGGVFGECTGAMKKYYKKHAAALSKSVTMRKVGQKILSTSGKDLGWESDTEFTLTEMVQKYIHLEYFHIYRTLYRSQTCALDKTPMILSCPESCDVDTPESECLCTCAGIDTDGTVTEAFDWLNIEPCLYGSDTSQTLIQNTLSEEMRRDLVVNFCSTGVKEGEMLESASPLDPLFWLIHPVLDRLLSAKRLASTSDITFGDYPAIQGFESEDWLEYSFYNSETNTCEGHNMYDAVLEDLPLPSHLIENYDVNGDGIINNIEFYEASDPTKEGGMNYIYDTFAWNHCEMEKVDPEAIPDELFVNGLQPTRWMGTTYKDLKTGSVRPKQSIKDHRKQVEAGQSPGKSLQKKPKYSGSMEDYNSIMAAIEMN